MSEKIISLMKNGTWVLVKKLPNTRVVRSKWVFKQKKKKALKGLNQQDRRKE